MQITRSSIPTVKGPADWFTGDVYIDAVAAAPEHDVVHWLTPVTDEEYAAAPVTD
ncbi:hypothetical protein [Streptomyces sp. Caat 7-52]|uniref:hypothetical protein n=1 Tax=Streptomyces sp. Caat 7-52 TaxID=2949637 RepID=UPI00203665FB|nr:hypothetical protein [Streptomyces sp. Caat 7-52]